MRGGTQGGSADVTFSVLNGAGSDTQEAVWWQPRPGVTVIALGNSSNTPLQTRLQFSNGETQEVNIAPFATRYIRRNSSGSGSSNGFGESVKLTTTGSAGSLKTTGFVVSNDRTYTSSIRFYDTLNTVQPNLFATNFRVKNHSSHLLLKNTSTSSVTAQARFRPAQGNGAAIELPATTLAVGEIKELGLQPLQTAAATRADLDSVSVQITNSGTAGSLIGALYGTHQTTGVFYDVPLRDSGQVRNSTGAYPVRLSDDYKTVVSITNVGNETAQFRAVIRHGGGQYTFSPRTLNVGQTATFDIKQIRDQQTPDQNGNVLPATMTVGQFGWSLIRTPKTARLVGRSEVVSRSERVSSSYSCPVCCPDNGPNRNAPSFLIDAGSFSDQGITETWYDCYLNSVTFASWMPGLYTVNSSIATAEMLSDGTMRGNGFDTGETTWFSAPYYVWNYQRIGFDYCEDYGNNQTNSGPINVGPMNVVFTTVRSTSNNVTAAFTEGFNIYNADLNLAGGTNVCSASPIPTFELTLNFNLPYGAESIYHPDPRTYVNENDNRQFQYLDFRFEDVVYSPTGRGKVIIRMRRVSEPRPDKTLEFRMAGSRRSGGSYTGAAKVTFICPPSDDQ